MGDEATQIEMVHVLEQDPALGRHLPPGARYQANSAAVAPVLSLARGVRSFVSDEPPPRGHLGLLILDGLIALHVTFGQIGATEFLGPCDVLRPWAMSETVDVAEACWETLTPVRLAVLDREFATRVRPWPEMAAALFDRYTERLASQLLYFALRQAKRVDDRVLVTLWHFAVRWGQVSAEGRIVPLPNITGESLGNIVGARRQSVSTALGALVNRGAIQRRSDGSWLIRTKPPQLQQLNHESARRAVAHLYQDPSRRIAAAKATAK
ncbi:MAG: helix-turn-helix domain-containing protein [Solirubrobacteraceae bacterium]